MALQNYSILINTCDKFEDCWKPFFKLFKIYWPEYNGKIYLNTEYKDFSYEGLNIICLKVAAGEQDAHKITWSECLMRALEKIDADIVLYMQEDYFLKDYVKNELVEKYASLFLDNEIDCIHLTDQAVVEERDKCKLEGLNNVKVKQRYRISCQAALWRKDVLHCYLRTYENAWQFEEFGSKRASILKHKFYVVDRNWVKLDKFEIIPYIFTGIVQGKWYEKVVPLFSNHNIKIDFSKRGFLGKAIKPPIIQRLKNKFKRVPIVLKNWQEIFYLKFRYRI